jgi:hypothetical protein
MKCRRYDICLPDGTLGLLANITSTNILLRWSNHRLLKPTNSYFLHIPYA